ncbi:hypothetical protein PQR39_35355 [Paraburkholderia sediminicola]|uniref:hypothetical protein n=1 Tax=Paraburkholderia sediminicola TaxID=458836 RepID=UPI0038BB8E2A
MNKTSERMLQAIEMVRAGESVPAAAKFFKLTHVAIYVSPLYEELCAERRAAGIPVRHAKHRRRPAP